MSRKTEEQVAEMKKQTIGVEVEMNSITRPAAAKLAAEFFGTGRYEDTARPMSARCRAELSAASSRQKAQTP